jgi:YVTN family beta-propeller protein
MPGFVVMVGTKLYVAAITLDEPKTVQAVSVIDAASGAMTATIPIPAQYNKLVPYAAVSPDGSHVFVGAIGSNMTGLLMVIDTATDTVAGTVDVPSPRGIAVSPDGSTIYVTNFWEGTVSVLAKTYKWDPPHLPDMVGHLIGGVANGGGGWLIIGDHCYKIPPRPLALFTIARAAAPFLSKPIVNRKLGEQLRKLR